MDDKLKTLHRKVKAVYVEAIDLIEGIRREVPRCTDLEELSDTAFAMSETNKLVEDLGKECRKILHLSEKLVNLICLKTNNPGPVRTQYVTASLRQKMAPPIPPRDTPEYQELCDWLNIDPMARDSVRIHYPTLRDKISEMIAEGKPIPTILTLQPEFNLTLRKRKEVDAA